MSVSPYARMYGTSGRGNATRAFRVMSLNYVELEHGKLKNYAVTATTTRMAEFMNKL